MRATRILGAAIILSGWGLAACGGSVASEELLARSDAGREGTSRTSETWRQATEGTRATLGTTAGTTLRSTGRATTAQVETSAQETTPQGSSQGPMTTSSTRSSHASSVAPSSSSRGGSSSDSRDAGMGPDASVPPPRDAGCSPHLASSFSAMPKGTAAPACTPADLASVAACFYAGSCAAEIAPAACLACIETPSAAMGWGPFVDFDQNQEFVDSNYGGCIAKIDPSPAGQRCATAYIEFEQCYDEACFQSCGADLSQFGACADEAAGSGCASYQDAVDVACANENAAEDRCDTLLSATAAADGGLVTAEAYLSLFCGLPDGGG